MTKTPLTKAVLPGEHHPFKTRLFGILFVLFFIAEIIIDLALPRRSTLASDLTTGNITQSINQQRTLRNLPALNTNTLLTEAAQYKSDDMQARHYFAHIDPDGHYIWDKIVALGYTPYLQLGENLAINFYDTDSLINAWMNSPEHRANILNDGFVDQGMGVTLGDVSQNQYYSAIANTFGALAKVKTPAAQAAAPPAQTPPAPAKTPAAAAATKSQPAATTSASNPTPKAASSVPPSPATSSPVLARQASGQTALSAPVSGYSLPQQNAAVPTAPATSTAVVPGGSQNLSASASALIGNDQSVVSDYQANRDLILAAGIALLLLMLVDIKKAVEKKLGALDKKTNNLVLLIITLLVVAFMYWF